MADEHSNTWWQDHFEKRLIDFDKLIHERIADLEKYLYGKIGDLDKLIDAKLEGYKTVFYTRAEAEDKATRLAAELLNTRLETMNNIREQLRTQREEFVTMDMHEALISTFNAKYEGLGKNLEDKYQRLCDDIKALQLSKANLEGKATTSSVYIAYLFTGISAVGTIMGIVIGLIGVGLHFLK